MDLDIDPYLSLWKVRMYCFHHQLHLIGSRQLQRRGRIDQYFSVLAVFVNVWRAHGNVSAIRRAWARLRGDDVANEKCRALPLRPLRGRWCSAHHAEAFVLQCGVEDTHSILSEALSASIARKAAKSSKVKDDLEASAVYGVDTPAAYTARLSKWSKKIVEESGRLAWWQDVAIRNTSRMPITRLHFWLQKHSGDACLRDLVYEKTDAVAAEFDDMLKSVEYWRFLFDPALVQAEDDLEECWAEVPLTKSQSNQPDRKAHVHTRS